MKKILLPLIIVLFSCDVETPIEDNFVVEAFLFQGERVDDIKIKKTQLWNSLDSIDSYISDAEIKLFGAGEEYILSYNSSDENYFSNENIDIISGDKYGLEVKVGDRVATSETLVPSKPQGLSISESKIIVPPLVLSPALPNTLRTLFEEARTNITWDNSSGEYHYLTIKYVGSTFDPIFNDEIPGQVGDFFSNFSTKFPALLTHPELMHSLTYFIAFDLWKFGSCKDIFLVLSFFLKEFNASTIKSTFSYFILNIY